MVFWSWNLFPSLVIGVILAGLLVPEIPVHSFWKKMFAAPCICAVRSVAAFLSGGVALASFFLPALFVAAALVPGALSFVPGFSLFSPLFENQLFGITYFIFLVTAAVCTAPVCGAACRQGVKTAFSFASARVFHYLRVL